MSLFSAAYAMTFVRRFVQLVHRQYRQWREMGFRPRHAAQLAVKYFDL